ncbi:DUF1214 domain-containing protein [Sphaerimonospora cavernae]|uniref:DUF1214 domain-containing protein n=1 Tax=Sphaerimonospora cavernae TaxID=1740611 RepID=A0ABV6U3Z0_9ACTN
MVSNPMWEDFCDRLREAGRTLVSESAPTSAFDQAEGVRYLLRLLRNATLTAIEHNDPRRPVFTDILDPHLKCKIGADNPDNVYMRARVSAEHRYRISGTRGNSAVFTFGSKTERDWSDERQVSNGEIDVARLPLDQAGRFSFIASTEPPESGAWLPLPEGSHQITGRQSFLDHTDMQPAQVSIEVLDEKIPYEPLDVELFTRQLRGATQQVAGISHVFAEWTRLFMTRPHELPDWGQERFHNAGGDPTICYLHGYWNLAPDQAWVIETEVPDCEYWNFVLQNWWMESLDYDRTNTHLNSHTARLNDDGTVTIVVSAQDPGYGNWLSTAGHSEGTALLRWVKADRHPMPTCRVVQL